MSDETLEHLILFGSEFINELVSIHKAEDYWDLETDFIFLVSQTFQETLASWTMISVFLYVCFCIVVPFRASDF